MKRRNRQRDQKTRDSKQRSTDQRETPRKVDPDALADVTGGDDDNIVWGQRP